MTRQKALYLYKELVYMGKDYPAGYDFFIKKLRSAFRNRSTMTDPVEIEKAIGFGDFIKKGESNLFSRLIMPAYANSTKN